MRRRQRRAAGPWQPIKAGLITFSALAAFWMGGFGWFLATLPEPRPLSDGFHVDGIVVLTGSGGRIRAGLTALRDGVGERMLISGVHPKVGKAQIVKQHPDFANLIGCCVDLGHSARNTIGNAGEAAFWAEQNNLSSVLVITADFHMARSLEAFRDGMPGVRLEPYAVDSQVRLSTLAGEYTKFLVVSSLSAL